MLSVLGLVAAVAVYGVTIKLEKDSIREEKEAEKRYSDLVKEVA